MVRYVKLFYLTVIDFWIMLLTYSMVLPSLSSPSLPQSQSWSCEAWLHWQLWVRWVVTIQTYIGIVYLLLLTYPVVSWMKHPCRRCHINGYGMHMVKMKLRSMVKNKPQKSGRFEQRKTATVAQCPFFLGHQVFQVVTTPGCNIVNNDEMIFGDP